MRLEWLEDILAVAETGSLHDAAERRGLTQSAFSRRMQKIEEQVGVPLFDRSRKPVQLLDSTRALQPQIAQVTGMLRQLTVDLRQGDRALQNRLVISSQHALSAALTPSVIKEMQLEAREFYVRLRSANRSECLAQLMSHEADLTVFYRLNDEENPVSGRYIESMPIAWEAFVPVVSAEAHEPISTLIKSGELPIIAYPVDVFLGQVMTRRILPVLHDALPVVRAETALTLAALELALAGLGVAWLPLSLAQTKIANGDLINLQNDLPTCQLEVVTARLTGPKRSVENAVWEQFQHYAACVRSKSS